MRNIPRSRIGAGHGIAGAVSIISNHRLTQEQGNLIRGVITWSQPPPTWLNRNHGIMPTWPEQLWSRCTQTQYLQQTSVIRIMHYAVAPLPHVTRLIYFQPMEEIKYYLDQSKPAICVTWCQLRSVSWNWYLCCTSQLCSQFCSVCCRGDSWPILFSNLYRLVRFVPPFDSQFDARPLLKLLRYFYSTG